MRVVVALAGVYGARFWARTVERYYSRVLGKAFVDCAPGFVVDWCRAAQIHRIYPMHVYTVQYSAAHAVAYSTHGEFVFITDLQSG